MKNLQPVILVDEYDHPVGTSEKLAAHQQGLLHRAFSVFVFRMYEQRLELLLQQRQKDKYHSSSLWTNTCCSHPFVEENIIAAGERRLAEEMGLHLQLTHAGNFIYTAQLTNGLIEHEFDHVLIGKYNNEPININPQEVAAFKWLDIVSIQQSLKQEPQQYTPWLHEALIIELRKINTEYPS